LPDITDNDSATSRTTRSSITASLVSRMSQIEGTFAKVDKLDSLMNKIAQHLGIVTENDPPPPPPSTPPQTVLVQVEAAVPVTQIESANTSQADDTPPPTPDGGRPLTHVGPPSDPTASPEIRQSQTDTAKAGVSSTDAGPAR
jgi:hypothetical protein